MAEEQIVTNIVAKSDFSNLITDLNKVSSALTGLQDKLQATNKTLAAQVAVMNRSFAETMRSTGQFSTHFVSLSSDVEKFGSQLDKGQMKLGKFFQTYSQHIKSNGGLIRDLAKQQVQLQNSVLQPLGRNAEGMMQYNVHIPRGLDVVKNKTAIAKQELMIMNKVIQEGAGQLINWGKNTQWAGRQLTVGLTVPLLAFGKASADAFKNADQQLVRLTKVYGGIAAVSSQELGKVRQDVIQTANEIAKAYGSSFTDTIALAADIAATGKQGNELLGSIKETTRLAVLGEVDRQDAMKATLAIQTAFKQNTEELSESINFLNAVENQTSTTLNDLVEAIPKAGPIVKGLGGDVKDLALYLTAMREGGINASEGANALKSGLASLINPTKVAKGMFEGFGISLTDIVQRNAGDTTATILELQSALETLNPLQKQQALEQLFGKFQFARMNALFENLGKQGSQTLQVLDLMKASSQELGSLADRELLAVTESASGKYRRAIEGLKADLAGVGEQFLKINTSLIKFVNGILDFAQSLPNPIKQALGFIGMITAASGPLIMLTGVLANFFGYIIKGASHFRSFFKGGEGWKLLTPEILAAQKAGNLVEQTFYSDAKAAAVLKQAISSLSAEFATLEQRAMSAAVSVNPAVSTVGGTTIMAGSVNSSHPLVGKPGTRAAAHHNPRSGMSQSQRDSQTIHSVTPAPIPVNQKIGAVPQIFMGDNFPQYEGLTTSKGVSTGIVAGEAAKWHAMMGSLSMMTKQEVAALKKEIARTGTFSAEINSTFGQLLPAMTKLTSNAATESAAIVRQLQSGKITVDAARTKIIAVNAELERLMAQTTSQVAAGLGRTANLTQVPLINQPIVSNTGKSNIKEIFRPNRKASGILDKIAKTLGVRTWGGGYSTETTIPKRFNTGNIVPGTGNTDTVPAMLTPGEFVVNKKSTQENLSLLHAINGGGISNNGQYNKGGKVTDRITQALLSLFGKASESPTSPQRAHMAPDEKSLLMWSTRRVNQNTRSNTKTDSLFMTGNQIADDFDFLMSQGLHPMDLIQESGMKLGYSISGSDKDRIYKDFISKLRNNHGGQLFGGKNNIPLEVVADSILRPHLEQFTSSKSTMPNYYEDVTDLQTVRGSTASHPNRSTGFISRSGRAIPRGIKSILSTATGGSKRSRINFSLKNLSPMSRRLPMFRNLGGSVPGYNLGGVVGNVLKGTAFKNVGAKFGKIGDTWGATSMSLGMGKKLFGSSGLTPKAQNLMYGKLIENLEKERPYGYVKDARGSLQRALEPDIVDTLLKSSASDVLSSGGKSLSKIDREILKTKFANWDSKSWTPSTSKVRKQMFGMNKGGMVGGRIPGVQYYNQGGGPVSAFTSGLKNPYGKSLVSGGMNIPQMGMGAQMGIGMGGMMVGSMVGGPAGTGIMLASNMLPLISGLKGLGGVLPTVTKLAGVLGKLTIPGAVIGGAFMLGKALLALKKNYEDVGKANRLAFGGTQESFASVGITKFKTLSDRIKEVNEQIELNKVKAQSSYEQYTKNGPTGITLSIAELNKAVEEAKKNQTEYIEAFNKIDSSQVNKYASDLKAQFVAMGLSASEASNKIYAMIKASEKAGQSFSAVTSNDFRSIIDQSSALAKLFENLSKASTVNNFNPEEFATGLETLINSVMAYQEGLIGTKDAVNPEKIISAADSLRITMEKIGKINKSNATLNSDQVNKLKEQNVIYASILGKAESLASVTAKVLLYNSELGSVINLSRMSGQEAIDLTSNLSVLQNGLNQITEDTNKGNKNPLSFLAGAIARATTATKDYATSIKTAQKQDADYYRNKIKAIDLEIKKINEAANARKKALQDQQDAESFATEIKKKQIEYQDALAAGDMSRAAQAQADIQQLTKEKQIRSAIAAIDEKAAADIKIKEAQKQKLQDAEDKFNKGIQTSMAKSAETTANLTKLKSIRDEIERLSILGRTPGADKEGIKKQIADILIGLKTGTKDERSMYSEYEKQYGGGDRPYNQRNPLSMAGNLLSAMNSSINSKGASDSTFQSAVTKFDAAVNKFANNEPIQKFRMAKEGEYNKKFGAYDTAYMTFEGPTGDKQTKLISSKQYQQTFDSMIKNKYVFLGYSQTNSTGAAQGATDRGDKGFQVKKAYGGFVSGPGTSTSDSIPAMLSNGEYVINADSVKKYGVQTFEAFNNKKYAMGGYVQRTPYAEGGLAKSSNSLYNINVTLNGSDLDANDVARAIHREMKMREIASGRSRTL